MAHKDIPSRRDIDALAGARIVDSVSIYTPVGVLPEDGERGRIELKNQLRAATQQMEAGGSSKESLNRVTEAVDSLLNDPIFWQYQSNSLATFIGDGVFETFRIPNRLSATVDIADRFYIKPLARTLTFKQAAYVLALAQNSVRLVRVSADQPAQVVKADGMPSNLADFLNLDLAGKGTFGRSTEDQNVRAQQFTAAINRAILPVMRDSGLPLIVAAAEPLASAYRRANSYKHLADQVISGNPEAFSDEELAEKTRPILDELYTTEIAKVNEDYAAKAAQGLGTTDIAHAARAAVYNAIDTLLIDIDTRIPGFVNEDGSITTDEVDDSANYGVADEILRRTLLVNGRVYAVRSDEMPEGAKVAATFRFPV